MGNTYNIQVAHLGYKDQKQLYYQALFIRFKTKATGIYRFVLIITNNITKRIHHTIVKGKGKFILKSFVHHMIS